MPLIVQASKAALKNHVVYAGTKGALDIMAKVMALELGAHNIRVNCVNPTVVLTDMGRANWTEPSKAEGMLSRIPLHRFAGNNYYGYMLLCFSTTVHCS